MKKRFTEEQIIGFLREADAGMPIEDLCRRHGFAEPNILGKLPNKKPACAGFFDRAEPPVTSSRRSLPAWWRG